MRRLVLGLVVAIACGPAVGDGDGDGDGDATSQGDSSSGRSSAGDASSDITVTDGTTTIVDDTSGVLFDVGSPETTTGGCEPGDRCPLPGDAFVEIVGTTPLGEVAAAFAWSGQLGGECAGTRVVMMESVEAFEATVVCGDIGAFEQPDPSLWLDSSALHDCEPANDEGTLTHLVAGMEATIAAQVEITACEERTDGSLVVLAGGFTASGEGWDLTGTFVAPGCKHLDIGCP